ncbi:MAG: AAA family ATPase, partial [bacterium]|nr:AAA family ATPase [bacterium]
FFNVLKGGTDGPFSRLFLTGVSPVTLDDVTSGYNIGKNISLLPGFNTLLGFTSADVEGMLDYYRGEGVLEGDSGHLMDILRDWYGNYCFSEDAETSLFNPDMVLYFTDHYLRSGKPPRNLIDRNARMDYGKLRHLILVDKSNKESGGMGFTTNGNFTRLQEIIQKGEIDSDIIEGFPLERLAHRENFISLLFYFGLLTIKKEAGESTLQIPNETARRLYYDYIKEAYEETGIFRLDLYTYNRLIKGMAMKGEWEPFFQFIAEQMGQSLSLRDLISDEKSVQVFLNVYLGLSDLFIIHTEKELNKGYADIVAEPFTARYPDVRYSYILEVKYLKRDGKPPGKKRIRNLATKAGKQLDQYSLDEKLAKKLSKTQLIKLVLIFSGHQLIYTGPPPKEAVKSQEEEKNKDKS